MYFPYLLISLLGAATLRLIGDYTVATIDTDIGERLIKISNLWLIFSILALVLTLPDVWQHPVNPK